jgi:hypothetical protein
MRISFSFVMRDLCLQREVCVFGVWWLCMGGWENREIGKHNGLIVVSWMNKTMAVVCMMPGLCGNLRFPHKALVN